MDKELVRIFVRGYFKTEPDITNGCNQEVIIAGLIRSDHGKDTITTIAEALYLDIPETLRLLAAGYEQ